MAAPRKPSLVINCFGSTTLELTTLVALKPAHTDVKTHYVVQRTDVNIKIPGVSNFNTTVHKTLKI